MVHQTKLLTFWRDLNRELRKRAVTPINRTFGDTNMKHPAGPFSVIVRAYRLSPYVNTMDRSAVYISRHRSANGAARRLAQLISGRTKLSVDCRRAIPRDFAGQYLIACGDGTELALNPFRAKFA
jgi:hypothetical protein